VIRAPFLKLSKTNSTIITADTKPTSFMSSKSWVTITELDDDTVLVGLVGSKEDVSRKKHRQSKVRLFYGHSYHLISFADKTRPADKVDKLAGGRDLGTYVELLEDRIALAHYLINDLRADLEQEKFVLSFFQRIFS